MTRTEAEAVTDIGEAFRNTNIVHFDEFEYFTGLTSTPEKVFNSCRSLTSVVFPTSVTQVGVGVFWSCLKMERAVFKSTDILIRGNGGLFQECYPPSLLYVYWHAKTLREQWADSFMGRTGVGSRIRLYLPSDAVGYDNAVADVIASGGEVYFTL